MEIKLFLEILKIWWWFFFPILTFFTFRFFYFWWIQWEVYTKKAFQWILLEIKPPKEVIKPFSVMENVFSFLWRAHYDSGNWRERWCNGAPPIGYGGRFSFEICSFGGKISFYLRIPKGARDGVEAAIYSQYPTVEISEVEDYVQKVPADIPNEKWDLYSEDIVLLKDDHFPIKTYSMFLEKPEEEKRIVEEEKRIDPMDHLLEGFSNLLPGEQAWIQISCTPILDELPFFKALGQKERNNLLKRASPPPAKATHQKVYEAVVPTPEEVFTVISGVKPAKKKAEEEEKLLAPELRLSPIEKEQLLGIERKLNKENFLCWIRATYLYRKDQPTTGGGPVKFWRAYFMGNFSAPHLNGFVYFGGTRTRIHYWLKERRLYLRKRQQLRRAKERLPSLWPRTMIGLPAFPGPIKTGPGKRATCILSTEELATIFHFPIKIITPAIEKVEIRKIPPPPSIPTE